jgi:hypothetical protein
VFIVPPFCVRCKRSHEAKLIDSSSNRVPQLLKFPRLKHAWGEAGGVYTDFFHFQSLNGVYIDRVTMDLISPAGIKFGRNHGKRGKDDQLDKKVLQQAEYWLSSLYNLGHAEYRLGN